MARVQEVTRVLEAMRAGEPGSSDALVPLVYAELHELAERALRGERPGHTLQPTALVHEAFLRLIEGNEARFRNRAHFFGAAAKAMRRILVDYARSRQAHKRGGGRQRVTFDPDQAMAGDDAPDLAAVDDALARLEARDPHKSRIVELHFFAGLPFEDVAEVLGMSLRTVKRQWSIAKARLMQEMEKEIEH